MTDTAIITVTEYIETVIDAVEDEKVNDKDLFTVSLVCGGCGRTEEVYRGAEPMLRELVEHVLFQHSTREDIHLERSVKLHTGYHLGQLFGLPAVTTHEERWREAQ